MKHELTRRHGGKNEMGWAQPVCSCGWVGRKEYNYNDYKFSNMEAQQAEHLASVVPLCAGCGKRGAPLCRDCEEALKRAEVEAYLKWKP